MNKRFTKKKKQKSNFIFFHNYEKISNNNPIELHRAIFSPISISFQSKMLKLSQKRKKIPSKRELQNPRTFINPNRVSLPSPSFSRGNHFEPTRNQR